MAQKYSSKNTSTNTTKLPRIYTSLWLSQLYRDIVKDKPINRFGVPLLYDYGAGRSTNHIKRYVEWYGFQYIPWDPYWTGTVELPKLPDVVICSNVLNVIDDNEEMNRVHSFLRNLGIPYFITVYEGDKTGVGRLSKNDCWQRNQPYVDYMTCSEVSKYGVITRPQFVRYITKEHN